MHRTANKGTGRKNVDHNVVQALLKVFAVGVSDARRYTWQHLAHIIRTQEDSLLRSPLFSSEESGRGTKGNQALPVSPKGNSTTPSIRFSEVPGCIGRQREKSYVFWEMWNPPASLPHNFGGNVYFISAMSSTWNDLGHVFYYSMLHLPFLACRFLWFPLFATVLNED